MKKRILFVLFIFLT